MCSATIISLRVAAVKYAVGDPVFEGMHHGLRSIPFCTERMPEVSGPLPAPLSTFTTVLPLAHRAWSRPGRPPRAEWMREHGPIWTVASRLIDDGTLPQLAAEVADVATVVDRLAPVLLGAAHA